MAMEIKEFLTSDGLEVKWNVKTEPFKIKESYIGKKSPIDKDSILVDNEGIHSSMLTRNYTYYEDSCLMDSVPTWTSPYLRPLIMHHNDKDGKIIGRIVNCEYINKGLSGTGALLFTSNIPDKDGKEQILDGRLVTTSIGAIAHDARCSICGQNIAVDGECEHERGEMYDVDGEKKLCYWIFKKIEGKELSYVIVPSDIYAQNTRVYKPDGKNIKEDIKENMHEGVLKPMDDYNTLKISYDKLVLEKAALEKELESKKDIEKKLSDKELENAAIAKELSDEKLLLSQTQKSLETAQKDLGTKETECSNEKTLRESAENESIKLKSQIKESLISSIVEFNKLSSKEIDEKKLKDRSEESLKDTLVDVKEDFTKSFKLAITEAKNHSLSDGEHAEDGLKTKKDINIKEQMLSILDLTLRGNN